MLVENLKKIPKIYWLLLMVLIIGGVNIFYNYGVIAGGGDESLVINSALKFFRDFSLADKYNTFLPGVIILYIPFIALVLISYLLLGMGSVSQLKELVIVDIYKFVPYFRFITIIFGVVAVYVFYKICMEVFKKERLSLIASYLLATSLLFVGQIHLAGAWIAQTMMILISLYYSLILLKKREWHIWDFIISAALIVLSTGIEFVGFIAIVPFFLVCWQRRKDMGVNYWINNLFLFFLTIILGSIFFIYLNPFAFWDFFSVFNKATDLGLGVSYYGRDIWGRFSDPFWIIILLEPLLLGLAFLGMIIARQKNNFSWKFFGLYALIYYLVLGPLLGGVVERRLLPVIPALAVFAALFIDFLLGRHDSARIRKIVYGGLLFFLINPLVFDAVLLKKGSVIETRKWINENIPANSSILDKCRLELNENKEVLNEIKQNYLSFLTTREKYLLDKPALLEAQKGYFVIGDFVIGKADIIRVLGTKKFQYLTICYFNEGEKVETMKFLQNIKKIKIYSSVTNQKKTVGVNLFNSNLFNLFGASYYGPDIEIYMLKDY